MKIYFTCAISGINTYGDNYHRIVKKLHRLKHTVISDHVLNRIPNQPETYPEPDHRKYFESAQETIKSCDIVVAEVSKFTPGISYEVAYALEQEVPVLALCLIDIAPVSPFLVGNTNPLMTFHRYKTEEIEDTVQRDLLYMKHLTEKQFSFTITPNVENYLKWVTKTKHMTKGLFIRLLVENALRKDLEYYNATRKDDE